MSLSLPRTRTGRDSRPCRNRSTPKPPRSLPSPAFVLDAVDLLVAYRLHWDANPLRPKRHPRGKFRFDAPRDGAEYGVTYANLAEHGAFAEVYGDMRLISELEVTRRLSRLAATRPLMLIPSDDPTVQKTLKLDGLFLDRCRIALHVDPGAPSAIRHYGRSCWTPPIATASPC